MKEKLKAILFGILMLIGAGIVYFAMGDFTFYVYLIPLNNVIVGIALAVIGVLSVIFGLLSGSDKEKKEDNQNVENN